LLLLFKSIIIATNGSGTIPSVPIIIVAEKLRSVKAIRQWSQATRSIIENVRAISMSNGSKQLNVRVIEDDRQGSKSVANAWDLTQVGSMVSKGRMCKH